HKRVLVRDAPPLSRNEFGVASEEPRRAGRLVHVEGFTVRVAGSAGNVVKFQIGECRHQDHPAGRLEARRREPVGYLIGTERQNVTSAQIPWRVERDRLREGGSTTPEARGGARRPTGGRN